MILITLLAGVLRVIRIFEEERFSNDVYTYFKMAKNWAYHGSNYTYFYDTQSVPPLMPWLMAMGYNVGLSPQYSGLILGSVLGSLMPLGAFWITLNLFPETKWQDNEIKAGTVLPKNYFYALLAAFFIAVHPFFIRISVSCLREILYLPFIVFAVAFAISAIHNKSLWKWCFFSIATTLGNMARREAVILIGIFFIWQMVEFIVDRKDFRKNIKYYALASLTVTLIFLAMMLPFFYTYRDAPTIWCSFNILEFETSD